MKKLFFAFLFTASIFGFTACEDDKTEISEVAPIATVKTSVATVDETDVTLEGSYTYVGSQPVTVGFRYATTRTELLMGTIVPAQLAGDGAFLCKLTNIANGEYYYQAVVEVEQQQFIGKEGWFKVDFSAIPEVTTEAANFTPEGITLRATYKFDSKKIPIQLGFMYASSEEELDHATFQPATVEGNAMALTLTNPAECVWYCAVAFAQGNVYKGAVRKAKMTDLSLAGPANCFIVSEEGHYSFETKKPDGSLVVGSKVQWVWATPSELVSDIQYANGRISFTASDLRGNEVIALTDDNNQVVWSWHIWATEKPEELTYKTTTMLDRNLGATGVDASTTPSLGLYFQWGRKDPFIGANQLVQDANQSYEKAAFATSGTEPIYTATYVYNKALNKGFSAVKEMMSETMAVMNPTVFYGTYNSGGWKDANSIVADNWGGTSHVKANQDPCPAGYRVPEMADLSEYVLGLYNDGESRNVSNYSWGKVITYNGVTYQFPGSAFRTWSGLLRYPGRVIFLWSSTIHTTEKYGQTIYDWKSSSNPTCYAQAIRCIKTK